MKNTLTEYMTTNKHTAGPWLVETDGTSVAMGNQVIIVGPVPDGRTREEEKANARLIAAAPSLLAALRDCVEIALPEAIDLAVRNKLPKLVATLQRIEDESRAAIALATESGVGK